MVTERHTVVLNQDDIDFIKANLSVIINATRHILVDIGKLPADKAVRTTDQIQLIIDDITKILE